MLEEYFEVIALRRKCQQDYDVLQNRIADLREKIFKKYRPGYKPEVIVRVDNLYYMINDLGIRQIDLVESRDE